MQLKYFPQSELCLNASKHLHTYEIHKHKHTDTETCEHTRTHTCIYQATQASPENREGRNTP